MAVFGAHSTYDPFVIKEWVGEAAASPRLRNAVLVPRLQHHNITPARIPRNRPHMPDIPKEMMQRPLRDLPHRDAKVSAPGDCWET